MKTFAFLRRNPFYDRIIRKETDSFGDLWEGGLYNGYVGFFDDLEPSYQSSIFDDLDDYLDDYITVHGGITYDGKISKECPIIPITEIPENWYEARIVGFDTLHLDDTHEEWNYNSVRQETLNLQQQIEASIDRFKIM